MEVTSAENAKVSDSAYSNSCSNSQSQRSSGSSKSRRSNSSGSSGYCGGPSSTLASSNAALPQPISKRKDKENKKKKSKPMIVGPAESETPVCAAESPLQEAATPVGSFPDVLSQPESEKTVEVADIELVDATDPGEHNSISDDAFDSTSTPCSIDDTNSQSNKGFCAVISMYDGVILHTTSSLSAALGFPKDTWIGRSFIEFVHPKDRDTFTGQIANGIAAPHADNSKRLNGQRTSLFCGLRKYRGAKFNKPSMNEQVKMKKPVRYLPFHLTLTCRDFHEDNSIQDPKAMFLIVTAQPVLSAYQAPEETIISSKFTTRHTATCHFSHCDFEVVQYFGYLPQDMIGRSLFEFYHPEDLPFMKDIYETVVKLRGTSFRSKPYRFAVQNGGYVLLETEWSSFVNPWSRKLESVIGHHRVLRGPSDPDIFKPSDNTKNNILANISDEVLEESKIIQEEIHVLLNEVIPSPIEVPEQCTGLVSFVENLLVEAEALESKNDIVADVESFSVTIRAPLEHDSVMLGQTSVHHENFGSKSSTETPLSYNRLNYIENIQRYFQSEPITTTVYESDEKNVNVPSSANDEDMDLKTKSPTLMDPTRKCMSQLNSSGAGSSKSAGNSSSGSNNKTSFTSRGETCFTMSNTTETASSKLSTLTVVVLSKHNEDMEKQLVQRHRQIRSSIKSDKLKDSQSKSTTEQSTDVFVNTSKTPALKRTGSPIEKGGGIKVSKRKDISTVITPEPVALNPTISNASAGHSSTGIQNSPNIIGWLSQSIGVPSMQTSQPYTSAQNVSQQISTSYPAITQMIPIFYFPTPQNTFGPIYFPQEHPGPPESMQSAPQSSPYIQYLTPSMAIYPPVYGAPTPTAMMYGPMYTIPHLAVNKSGMSSDQNRLASQAASVKAEPGNIRTVSECSKRVLSLGELCSPCVSADEDCHGEENGPPAKNAKQNRPTEYNEDETSCSSLYSSFLNKSSGSSCNPDQKGAPERLVCVPWKVGDNLNSNTERRALRKPPPWLEGVVMTPELIYQYQMDSKTLQEVLEADKNALKNLTQPLLVNDQLSQLYLDLELDGFGTKLMLDEGFSSNESASATSTDEGPDISSKHKKKWYNTMDYGQLVVIHEENAPFPPPQSLVTIGSSH